MIPYFPTLYEDEILFSAFTRYSILRGLESNKAIIRELLGSNVKTIFEMPTNMNYFSKEISIFDINDSDGFIDGHTMFGYFTSFINQDDTNRIREYMKNGDGHRIYAKLGLLATDVKLKSKPFVCAKCIEECIEESGEVYVNRLHQLPGVYYCHIHKNEILKITSVDVRSGNRHEFKLDEAIFRSDELIKRPDCIPYHLNEKEKLIHDSLLKDSIWLFSNRKRIELKTIKNKFRRQLDCHEGLTINGSVRQRTLRSLFEKKFTPRLASLYGVDIDILNFATEILQVNNRKTHPFKYLLLSNVLGLKIQELYSDKVIQKEGLPCLNRLCMNFRKFVLTEYLITADYKSRVPVVTVVCSICGYTYSRKKYSDPMTVGRVKDFGKLWQEELIKTSENEAMSLRSKATYLGCDPATYKKYLLKLT